MFSWLLSQLGHACADQLPSLSYHSFFCSNYRKCFPEIDVLEEHLICFFSRLRPGNKDIWYHITHCVLGVPPQDAPGSCYPVLPGHSKAIKGPSRASPALCYPPIMTRLCYSHNLLVHSYFIVLEPLILHCLPQLSTKLILFSKKELVFAKRLFFKERQFSSTGSIL